jgi:hypothetical protein
MRRVLLLLLAVLATTTSPALAQRATRAKGIKAARQQRIHGVDARVTDPALKQKAAWFGQGGIPIARTTSAPFQATAKPARKGSWFRRARPASWVADAAGADVAQTQTKVSLTQHGLVLERVTLVTGPGGGKPTQHLTRIEAPSYGQLLRLAKRQGVEVPTLSAADVAAAEEAADDKARFHADVEATME